MQTYPGLYSITLSLYVRSWAVKISRWCLLMCSCATSVKGCSKLGIQQSFLLNNAQTSFFGLCAKRENYGAHPHSPQIANTYTGQPIKAYLALQSQTTDWNLPPTKLHFCNPGFPTNMHFIPQQDLLQYCPLPTQSSLTEARLPMHI